VQFPSLKIWDVVSKLDFCWWSLVDRTELLSGSSRTELDATVRIYFKDGNALDTQQCSSVSNISSFLGQRWTISVRELSSIRNSFTFEVTECVPAISVTSIVHNLCTRKITSLPTESAFIEWNTYMSSDISVEVATDSSFKRREAISDLTNYLQQVDRKSDRGFDKVAFYGRPLQDYETMFNVDFASLDKTLTILDCPGGPSSFQAEARSRFGLQVVSADPMYSTPFDQLETAGKEDIALTINKMRRDPLTYPGKADNLVAVERSRYDALGLFLADFKIGHGSTYIASYLPDLPFQENSFDLTFCAFLLCIYSSIHDGGLMNNSMFDLNWHREAIRELIRVTKKELRVFPCHAYTSVHKGDPHFMVLDGAAEVHPYVKIIVDELAVDNTITCKYFKATYSGKGIDLGLLITKII
jgi:hypothetical protein